MRVEQRGRVTRACAAANRGAGGAGEQAEAIWYFQGGGLGGISQGQGQQGGGRRRRAVDRGVREGPQGEPLQALEPDVLGELLPTASSDGRDTEAGRARGPCPRCAHRGGQDRSDGREDVPGAEGGAYLPPRLLRVPTGAVGAASGGGLPGAMLEAGLGHRPGHHSVVRYYGA